MININYGDKVHQLRNTPDELTLEEFDKIYTIVNRPTQDTVSKYFEVFEFLNVPDEVLDSLNQADFIRLVKDFNDYKISTEIKQEITIKDKVYRCFEGEEFEFLARDISLIEQKQLENDGHFPSWVAAIMFKDVTKTAKENRSEKTLESRARNFRKDLNTSDVVPLIARVAQRGIKQLNENI